MRKIFQILGLGTMNYESHCRVLIAEMTAIAAAVAPHVSEYIGLTPHADETFSLTDSVSVLGRDACNEKSVLDEVPAHTFTKTRYRLEVTSGADGGVRIKVQSQSKRRVRNLVLPLSA